MELLWIERLGSLLSLESLSVYSGTLTSETLCSVAGIIVAYLSYLMPLP